MGIKTQTAKLLKVQFSKQLQSYFKCAFLILLFHLFILFEYSIL